MPKKTKLIDSKSELMNCVDFRGKDLWMKYKTCNPQG
jgi:hypothetical protein